MADVQWFSLIFPWRHIKTIKKPPFSSRIFPAMFDDRSFQLQLLLFKIFSSPGNVAGTSVWPSSALGRAEESEKSCFELQWNCAPWWCQLHMLHMLEAYRILPGHLLECQGLWRMSPWKLPSWIFRRMITNKLDQQKASQCNNQQVLVVHVPTGLSCQ